MEYSCFVEEFDSQIQCLSHNRLKAIMKKLRQTIHDRYRKNETNTCETVERAFSEEEFAKFMSAVKDPLHRACFIVMATLGLRVGELTSLKGKDLDREELIIDSTKGSYKARFRLPEPILRIIRATEEEDHLFPITNAQLRKVFSMYRAKVGLDRVYLYTAPCGQRNRRNKRYDLTLHSFRHYAIQKAYSSCKDPDLVRRLARHKHLETTLRYFRKNRKEEVEQLLKLTSQEATITSVVSTKK